jgi:hypothetical protein
MFSVENYRRFGSVATLVNSVKSCVTIINADSPTGIGSRCRAVVERLHELRVRGRLNDCPYDDLAG